jgi:hypothetical protein
MLEMGPIEQSLIKQSIRAGLPIPERIQNAPELLPGLNLYLIAFFDLDTDRAASFGYAPIPWSSIKDWALYHDLDGYQKETLYIHIRALDRVNAEYVKNKNGPD